MSYSLSQTSCLASGGRVSVEQTGASYEWQRVLVGATLGRAGPPNTSGYLAHELD
jgi:hypothetical protein